MNRKFEQLKWIGLIAFSLMYNLVYLSRFSINNIWEELSDQVMITSVQQELIQSSVFIAYAIGSFFNGYLADRWGAKKTIFLGCAMSGLLNMSIPLQSHWIVLLCIWLANGYFQSMIWVGGIALLANWWKEGQRGKGVGIANFFSGLSHATAYALPIVLLHLYGNADWKLNFALPVLLLFLFTFLFGVAAVEKPEDQGLQPYAVENSYYRTREEALKERKAQRGLPWSYFFRQKNFVWWCVIAMTCSICRYGLLNWIPLYYADHQGGMILSSSFSNLALPLGMAFGTLTITWIAGAKLFNNKGIIITAMAAICGTLVMIFPMVQDTRTVLAGIFFTGFALYGINGILWLYAIDQGGRVFSGSAAGILNGFAYLGACLEGVVFPIAMKLFPNPMTVFIIMELMCICMVICGMVVSRKNTVVVPEVRE